MKEALKLALEALEDRTSLMKWQMARDAVKAALAHPAQEPVAWMDIDEKGSASGLRYWSEPDNRHEVALYTTPPQRTWVGLTIEEIASCCRESTTTQLSFAQELEAKLKEKNT